MAYKVIKYFTDMQDNNFAYQVGDEYPRKGLKVMQSRINELAGSENRQGAPLIKEIEEPRVEKTGKKAKSDFSDEE